MQTTLVNTWMKPVRFFATGTCAVLFAAFTLCLSPAPAHAVAPPSPIVVAGPLTQLGTLGGTYGGGWDNGADPIGGSFAVGPNGDVIVGDGYGLGWLQITPAGPSRYWRLSLPATSNQAQRLQRTSMAMFMLRPLPCGAARRTFLSCRTTLRPGPIRASHPRPFPRRTARAARRTRLRASSLLRFREH